LLKLRSLKLRNGVMAALRQRVCEVSIVDTVGNVSKSYADVVRGTTRQSSRVTEVVRQSPVNGKM
jgi:hypothetical protein